MDNVMLKPGEMTDSDAQAASLTDKLNYTRTMARDMAAGFHLGHPARDGSQGTEYWSGPVVTIDPSLPPDALAQAVRYRTEFLSALRRSFASTNFVKETARRHTDAVIGHAPTAVMHATSDAVAKRAHDLAMLWWETLGVHKLLHGGTQRALVEGRAVLRLSLSPAALQAGADGSMTVKPMSADDLLRYLRPALLPSEQAWLWEDANLNPAAAYSYSVNDTTAQERIELAYVDEQGNTHLTVWDEKRQQTGVAADLKGRIPYLQLQLTPLITPQVLENQRAYNVVTTMANRNTELAGFLERYMINLEPPTTTVRAFDGTTTKRPIMRTGPGTMAVLFSKLIPRATPQGESFEPVGPGQYGRFEPTSAAPLMAALDLAKVNIFSETRQMFALMGADASASGRSREVAISDFGQSVQPTRRDVEHLGGSLFELLLTMLGALGNEPALKDVTVDFRCHVQPVPPSSQERQQDRADVEVGLIALATARHRQGIDNSDSEDTLIKAEMALGTSPLARAAVLSAEKQAANADGISTPKT